MKEIYARLVSQNNEMKLYMELADKKINGKVYYNFLLNIFRFYLEI